LQFVFQIFLILLDFRKNEKIATDVQRTHNE